MNGLSREPYPVIRSAEAPTDRSRQTHGISVAHRLAWQHFLIHQAQLKLMACLTLSLLMQSTVRFPKLALVLSRGAKPASNERRIQRFMSGYDLDVSSFGRFCSCSSRDVGASSSPWTGPAGPPCAEFWTYQYEHPHDRHLL